MNWWYQQLVDLAQCCRLYHVSSFCSVVCPRCYLQYIGSKVQSSRVVNVFCFIFSTEGVSQVAIFISISCLPNMKWGYHVRKFTSEYSSVQLQNTREPIP